MEDLGVDPRVSPSAAKAAKVLGRGYVLGPGRVGNGYCSMALTRRLGEFP